MNPRYKGIAKSDGILRMFQISGWHKHCLLIGTLCQLFIVPALFAVFQWLQEKLRPLTFDDEVLAVMWYLPAGICDALIALPVTVTLSTAV